MCKATTVLFQSEQEKTEVGKGVRKRQRTSQPSQYSSCTASSAGSCEEDSGGCSNNTPVFCRITHSSFCDEMCNPETKSCKERTLHRERQARACSQPPPPTLLHDQLSVRCIHQLELHRDRQREYCARLRARREPPPSHISPQPGDSMLVDVPELQPASAPGVPSPSHSDCVREANHIKQQRCRANHRAQPVHSPPKPDFQTLC